MIEVSRIGGRGRASGERWKFNRPDRGGVCTPTAHGLAPAGSLGQHGLHGVCLPIVTCPGPIRAPQLKAGRG